MNEVQKKGAEEVMELERQANAHWAAADVDWIDEVMLAPETVQLSPGYELMDRKGYAEWMKAIRADESANFSFEPTTPFICQSGEMGYVLGTTKLEVEGQPTRYGKYVSVLVKVDGSWKVFVEANNFNDA